jgi:hypothetical protein
MTAAPAGTEIRRQPRIISMHRFADDALIRCKGRAGIRAQNANPLIAFNSLRVAQPVLISEPDPDTPTAAPSHWARNLTQ